MPRNQHSQSQSHLPTSRLLHLHCLFSVHNKRKLLHLQQLRQPLLRLLLTPPNHQWHFLLRRMCTSQCLIQHLRLLLMDRLLKHGNNSNSSFVPFLAILTRLRYRSRDSKCRMPRWQNRMPRRIMCRKGNMWFRLPMRRIHHSRE